MVCAAKLGTGGAERRRGRENLKRRKAQARGRAGPTTAEDDGGNRAGQTSKFPTFAAIGAATSRGYRRPESA